MEMTHSFRLVETSEITQLTLHHQPDGQVLVPWEDIERAFPGVSPIRNGISVIRFLRGDDYERIDQCSRSMDVVLSVKSSPAGNQANSPIGVSATSVGNTDPLDTSPSPESGVTASSEQIEAQVSRRPPPEAWDEQEILSFLIPEKQESAQVSSNIIHSSVEQIATQASRRVPPEAEDEHQFLSFLIPEEQQVSSNIYHPSAMGLKNGLQGQELGELGHNIEANVVKNSKLQDEVGRLQKEMSDIMEAMKRLEKQVHSNQEEMKESQQQALPQIGVLRSCVKSILNRTYELHEYPISRLFAVLPQDPSCWDTLNPFSNKFRLYFLCECGRHTKSIKSRGPHEIHFAKHEGYEITRPSEFFQQYGQYILTLLKMLKARLSIAGVTVPTLSNLFPSDTIGKARISLTQLRDHIEHGMDLMIDSMEKISVNRGEAAVEFADHMEKKRALEGADLCKLGAFLKNKNGQKVLGNLYRTVSDEGHVKWVCIDHYRVNYQESLTKEFQLVLGPFGGSFSENDGRVVVRLRSSVLADQFYSTLERARSVYELDIDLSWACTSSDLEALERALRNSRVSVLRLDLQQFRTSVASDLLPTPTQYEVLFRIRDLPQVKVFHIVLSYENIEFPEISLNTSTHPSKISCELNLRAIEGRMYIGIITKALKINSSLAILNLRANNIGDDKAKALAEALKVNSTLTTLNLNDNNIGDHGAKALAEALKTHSTLTTLDLNDNNIGVDGVKALAEALKINTTLIILNLYYNNIGVDGAKALAEALKINSTLTTLDLNDTNIGVDGAKVLAEALKINLNLITLRLYNNYIGDDGAKALAEALKINSILFTLDLEDNNIGVDGAEALAEALKINTTLTTLNLNDNKIGVDGAKALAETLKINSTLITLDLYNSNIRDDGVMALAEALKINSTLITLDLKFNNIGVDGAEALTEARKINSNLSILR